MCGIYGIAGNIKDYDISSFKKMGDYLIYRGPDNEGTFVSENALMGMRRLSIIDLEGGGQPIFNEDKSLCIVCNGEIYNYKELRENLRKTGHKFSTNSDTEVILHLYEEYGFDFLNYLRGMFAIAIWDEKKNRLFLARDRFGKKPLYYLNTNGKIIFGSEIKIILSHPQYKKEIDPNALSAYFTFKNIPSGLSIFKDIKSLPPAHFLIYEDNKVTEQRYWRLDFSNPVSAGEEEIADDLLNTLEESIKLRTYSSDVPVGAYLSGGVDSSLVVGIMSRYCGKNLKTFSLSYEEEENPDILFANKVSKMYNTEHYEYKLSIKEIIDSLEDIVGHFDEPFGGVVSNYFLTKLISKHVKVALSGDGADELFGSYLAHRLAYPIHNYVAAKKSGNLDSVDWQCCKDNKEYVMSLAEENIWDWRSKLYPFSDKDKSKLLSSDTKPYNSNLMIKKYFLESTAQDPLNKVLELDVNTLLSDQVLTYVDRLSMAHSVETRAPFLDHIFAEKAAKVPGSLKIKGDITKYIFKKVAENYLPEDVIYRPKKGFILPLHKWMKLQMKDFTLSVLSTRAERIEFLNKDYINKILNEFYNEGTDHTYRIWTLIMFVLWYEKYFS
ncbi:MAG: asparagine synthase (glutamine-hydrolyzing) [Armatimonadota bacterium]